MRKNYERQSGYCKVISLTERFLALRMWWQEWIGPEVADVVAVVSVEEAERQK